MEGVSLRCTLCGLILLALQTISAGANPALDKIGPFLKTYCFDCHGPEKQKGELRYDTLGTDLSDHVTLETWQNILDQLNLGEMPPKKRKLQPTSAETRPIVDTLTAKLKLAYAKQRSTGGETVMRRLNRFELRNTLRDLLYLQGAAYEPGAVAALVDNNGNGRVTRDGDDPIRSFPEDELEDGFDTIGDRLVMSDFLLKLTLAAAQETLQTATHNTEPPTIETQTWSGRIVNVRAGINGLQREYNPEYEQLFQRYGSGARLSPDVLHKGVGASARYRITIEASAHNQKHPWGDVLNTDQDEPFRLGLFLADSGSGGVSSKSSKTLVKWELPDDGKRHSYSFETWIDASWLPWIGWDNGPSYKKTPFEKVVKMKLPDQYIEPPAKRTLSAEDKKNEDAKAAHNILTRNEKAAWQRKMWTVFLANNRAPNIRIHSMKLEPLPSEWPPRSHSALYGFGAAENAEVTKLMKAFAERAFRRPVLDEEIAPYIALAHQVMAEEEGPGFEPKEIAAPPVKAPAATKAPTVELARKKPPKSKFGITELSYKVYKGRWEKLPDFDALTSVSEGVLEDGFLDISVAKMTKNFGMVFEGKILAPANARYYFGLASDDGARILIDGKVLTDNDGLHGMNPAAKPFRVLKPGIHAIRVEYFQREGGLGLHAFWNGQGVGETWFHGPRVPAPVTKNRAGKPQRLSAHSARATRALQAGYGAILCSPRFLYIKEGGSKLDDYELAARLSYFLWSTMPDTELFGLARAGKLNGPKVLEQQTDRMLRDPKAASFKRHFPVTWLRLDKLGKMPPEKGGPMRFYHDQRLEPMMVDQAAAFFTDLLETNGNINNCIDSEYTFMNDALGKWIYGRQDISGGEMRKVHVNDPRRGGMFTMPGAMTISANGVDTSPVVRGVWVLENVLGTPPPPPPPDVEPLPTDLRNAKTIRERIAAHRKQESCAGCHRKIDPMGFAMENFDPVGRWRDNYPKAKLPIDPSATLSTGKEMADIVAFKAMLMDRRKLVARCLVSKMMTYSSGRILEITDRGEVDRIVAELEARGNGMRDLVTLTVQSNVFRNK
jgi:hypothetical protein